MSAIGCLKHVIGGKPGNTAVVSCLPQDAPPRPIFSCKQLCGRSAPRLFYVPGLDNSCNCGPGPGPCRLHRGKFWRTFCKRSSHPPPACAFAAVIHLGTASTRCHPEAWWPFGTETLGVLCCSSTGNIASQFSVLANTSNIAVAFQHALAAAVLVERQLPIGFGHSRCTCRSPGCQHWACACV